MATKITVEGKEIAIKSVNDQDYISLTDMAGRGVKATKTIENWMRTRSTLDFLYEWELLYNTDFNLMKFHEISQEVGRVAFTMSVKEWIQLTNAIGIQARAGRYGGTYAHKDIAFEFGTRISARFKLLLIREFQRLKEDEARRLNDTWNFSRFLSKVNYSIHTDAVKGTLSQQGIDPEYIIYASEADILNIAVFGITAKAWREANPELAQKGNIRDYAGEAELIVLSNLQSINAMMIDKKVSKERRAILLAETAARQLGVLRNDPRLEKPE